MMLRIAQRPVVSRWPSAAAWGRFATAYLLVPAVLGGLLFTCIESWNGLHPQEISISPAGVYRPYMDDFVVFYSAGSMVRDGAVRDVYEPDAVHAVEARTLGETPDAIIPLPFYNPPAMLIGLAPFAALPKGIAAGVWVAVEMLAFALAIVLLMRAGLIRVTSAAAVIPVVAVIASMPFHEVLLHGQVSLLLFLGWTLILLGSFRGAGERWTLLGLVLLAMKPQLAVAPLLYFAVMRRWRLLAAFAVVETVSVVIPAVIWGPEVVVRFVVLIRAASGWEDQKGIWIDAMFGWNAFVRDLTGPGFELVRLAASAALAAVTAAFVAAFARRHREPAETLAMLVFASLLVSPHVFAQDLVLTALPLLILTGHGPDRRRLAWGLFGAAGWMLTFVHFRLLHTNPLSHDINYVSLWLAAGMGMSALGMESLLSTALAFVQPRKLRRSAA
jgi:Glycosyltransferase family 87